MLARGKFVALEGIDGSGKRTQMELLARALAEQNIPFACFSFPRYNGFFGKMVARFLNGEFGRLSEVDAHFSAMLYAGDRFEARAEIEANLSQGKTVLADRYIGSNLAHQAARVAPRRRREFIRWLKQLEYEVYDLPAEDLVVYLRLPAAEAQRLVGKKSARKYTNRRRDLLEADLAHLKTAARIYDQLSKEPNWVRIECFVPGMRGLRRPEDIHLVVLAAVETRLARAFAVR